jgi:lysyl-tRNA synthetase class 2
LLAAGEQKIYEFARVFRDRERGDLHLPEFTMLEWYRANAAYDAIMADTIVVIAHAAQATGIGHFSFRGKSADPFGEPELLTVASAFERFAGIDLLATIVDGNGDRAALAAAARERVRVADDDTWSDIFSKVLVEHVEPNLGQGRLTVLFEYPAPEAALARTKPSDPRVAERFEVYACGVELANGFGELTDAVEQRHRFTAAMDEKKRRYGERYPLDEEFLAAVGNMPEASGVALGFDRLVMLASGALRIDQVVWTPPANEA